MSGRSWHAAPAPAGGRRLWPSTTMADALLALLDHSTPFAPVVDAGGHRVGRVTAADLLRAVLAPAADGGPCWTPERIPVSAFMAASGSPADERLPPLVDRSGITRHRLAPELEDAYLDASANAREAR